MLFVIYYLLFPRSQSGGTDADSFSRHGCGGVPTGGGTKQTPSAGDFDISGTGSFTHDGDPKTVTAKEGKTTGTVSVTYTGAGGAVSITAPSAAGTYTVTFDVTESAGWNSASGLSAGTLTITGIGPTTLIGITAEYTPATAIFTDTTLETLRVGLTVTAQYGDSTSAEVTDYTLSGELAEGESVITVNYTEGGVTKTADFTVTVDAAHVHNGGDRTFTAVHIPAFHRPDADSPYLSVTEIDNGTNTTSNNAFGGTNVSSVITANETLTTVTFAAESQLTTIGNYAFAYSSNLDGITIPASVTSIGISTFMNCTGLESVTLPDSVQSIDRQAFSACTSLASVTFAANSQLQTIDNSAFEGCTGLTSVTIPNSVTLIGSSTFRACTSLASVTFEGTISATTWTATNSFLGDLRDKFYATDSSNGTPGTYTTTAPVGTSSVWTKQ